MATQPASRIDCDVARGYPWGWFGIPAGEFHATPIPYYIGLHAAQNQTLLQLVELWKLIKKIEFCEKVLDIIVTMLYLCSEF